jgi:hypothetical protein
MVSRTSQWLLVRQQHGVHRQHGGGVAFGLDQPGADVQLVGAHLQDGVFQLAGHRQRVPGGAGGLDAGDVGRLRALRALDGEGGGALGAVDLDRDVRVAQRVGLDRALQRRQRHAAASAGRSLCAASCQRALLHLGGELRRLGDVVDQAPVLGLLAAHAFGGWCRRCRPGRGAPCACRSRGSGRRCRAARPAAAPRAG